MVLSRPFDSFQDHCILCIFGVYFQHFWCHFHVPKPKQVQTCQISNFQIPLCLLCLLCTRVSKSDRVLKTHSNHDNSNNKIGRQFTLTSEVTLIGPHIVSKLQPNPTIIDKVIHHFCTLQNHPTDSNPNSILHSAPL